jgi:hypothetical protein
MLRKLAFALALAGVATGAMAQQAQTPLPADTPKDCPPGTSANAPGLNNDSRGNLTDKLASSKGIICPPAGIDSGMQQKPPEGGALKIVPPPGSPGGDPRVQPK